jgi:hypothetical protein
MHLTQKTIFMKATILMITAVFVTVSCFSQPEDELEGRGAKNAEKLKKELNLDDNQFQKVKSINEKYADKLSAAKTDAAKSKEAVKALKNQREAEINTVLTKEQQEQWKAHRLEHKQQHEERQKERKEFKKELNLNEDQKVKVKAINDDYKTKKDALKEETNLTPVQRQEKMKALKEERKTKLQAVLTPEQYQLMKEEKEERKQEQKGKHHDKHKEKRK